MKERLKKVLCVVSACVMLLSTLSVAGATERVEVMPRFVGIDSQAVQLQIDENGRATCWCLILATSGYSLDVTMELERDGTVIKTWTGSGSSVELLKYYYVTKNHDYQLIITSRVKTLEGSYLLSYTLESYIESY